VVTYAPKFRTEKDPVFIVVVAAARGAGASAGSCLIFASEGTGESAKMFAFEASKS